MDIKRILAPTDFSDLATRSLEYAVELAKRTGAELVVIYADPFLPPPHFTSEQMDELVATLDKHRAAATRELESYAAKNVASEVALRTIVVEDTPAAAIVKTADAINADVIVMGTHGRTGLARVFVGSVAKQVLANAGCPVITVKLPAHSAAQS